MGRQTPSEAFVSHAAAVLDEHGRITAWNDAASGLLGYELEDVLGRPATSLLARDLPHDVGQRIADQREWSALAVLRHQSVGEATCRLRAFPLTAARRSIKWLAQTSELATGISERRDARSRTTAFKEWSWDRLAIPVAVCDGELRVVAVNRGMVELTGSSEDRLLTRRIEDIAPTGTESLEAVARLATEVLQSGSRYATRHAPQAAPRLRNVSGP